VPAPAPGDYLTIDDDPAEYWVSEGGDGASESAAYRLRPPVTGSVGYSPYAPVPPARAIFGPSATPAPAPLPVDDDENVADQPDVTASEFMPLLLRVSESVQGHDEFMNSIASQMQQQQQNMQRAFDRRDQAEAERERVREAQRSREAAEREELERAALSTRCGVFSFPFDQSQFKLRKQLSPRSIHLLLVRLRRFTLERYRTRRHAQIITSTFRFRRRLAQIPFPYLLCRLSTRLTLR
jgi:hypothetical protein